MPKPEQPQLKIRHLEAFLAAAKHANFGKAAEELEVSASALSQTIADLEADLGEGVRLFQRDQRGARLTPQGEALVGPARRMLEDSEALRNAVRPLVVTTETLRVAYVEAVATMVRQSIATILRKQPGLRVEASECGSEEAQGKLGRAEVDIAIHHCDDPDKTTLRSMPYSIPSANVCIMGENHPRAGEESVSLASLSGETFALPWLEPDAWCPGAIVREYFTAKGFAPARVMYRSNSIAAVADVVRKGLAISVVPQFTQRDYDGVAVIRVTPPWRVGVLGATLRTGYAPSAAADALFRELKDRTRVATAG